jgi:hypothetical protein
LLLLDKRHSLRSTEDGGAPQTRCRRHASCFGSDDLESEGTLGWGVAVGGAGIEKGGGDRSVWALVP